MSEELEVLKIVTQRLNKADISYMISGSIAANYYTVPRMTRDIDIIIELRDADIDNFVSIFQGDFYIDKEMIKKEVSRQGMFNLIHNQHVIKIDFIIRKKSEFQNAVFYRRKKVLIENSPMWFISVEDGVGATGSARGAPQRDKTMNDTPAKVAVQFQKLMRMKSNEERLRMGCSMFDTAKQIAKSAIIAQCPKISAKEIKKEFFLRFYGMEFSETQKEKILSVLRDADRDGEAPDSVSEIR